MDFQDSTQLVSAYDGFNISLIFLRRLWLSLETKVSSFSEDAYSAHTLFFGTVCFEAECYQEWAFALFHLKPKGDFSDFLKELFHLRKTDIDYEYEKDIHLNDLFSITIDFCQIYNKQNCNQMLQYAIDYLTVMKSNPEEHVQEWKIWKEVISNVLTQRKYLCSKFFWNFRESLGRFPYYDVESQEALEMLFSDPKNIVARTNLLVDQKDVYLMLLPDGRQLWGYVIVNSRDPKNNNTICDFGVNSYPNQYLRTWLPDSKNENGGYLAAKAPI